MQNSKLQKVVSCIDFKRKMGRKSEAVTTEILRLISQMYFCHFNSGHYYVGIREQERMNERMNHPYL